MIDVSLLLFIMHGAMVAALRELTHGFEGFSRTVAPVVVTAFWQGAIVAAALGASQRLARRASAGYRFAIWAAGFLALVLLPFLTVWLAGGAHGSRVSHPRAAASAGPWLRLDLRWSLAIGAVWIAASLFRAGALGVHSLRLREVWKAARPIPDGKIVLPRIAESQVPKCEGRRAPGFMSAVGAQRRVEVCTTKDLDRPAVIGFWAPRILIPEWLFEKLTPEELEHVVLHESEHLRRRDDWMNLAQKLCLVAFPLNPALAWMDKRLSSEREMACDEGVVRATRAPRAYAASLAGLAERGLATRGLKHRAEALFLGAWQRRPELVERVHRILARTPGLSPLATRALVGTMSCGLIFGSVEFARCPQLVAFVPMARPVAGTGEARYVNAGYELGKDGAGAFRAIDAVAEMPTGASDRANSRRQGYGRSRSMTARPDGQMQLPAVREDRTEAPREILLKAVVLDSSAEQIEEQAVREWAVLTALEQTEDPGWDHHHGHHDMGRDAGVRRDYDYAPTDNQADDQAVGEGMNDPDGHWAGDHSQGGHRSHGPGGHVDGHMDGQATVTQLVFNICPDEANGVVGSADAPGTQSASPNQAASSTKISVPASAATPVSSSSDDQPTAAIPLRDGWFVFQL